MEEETNKTLNSIGLTTLSFITRPHLILRLGGALSNARSGLPDGSQAVQRPVGEDGFAINEAPGDRAPGPAVVRRAPVVAQDKVFALRHGHPIHRNAVAVFVGDVGLRELFIVDENPSAADLDVVTGNANDSLDEGFGGVAGEPENHCIATVYLGNAEAIGEFVDENALLIDERRHHAGPFDPDGLVEEQDHDQSDQHAEGEVAEPEQSPRRWAAWQAFRGIEVRVEVRLHLHTTIDVYQAEWLAGNSKFHMGD